MPPLPKIKPCAGDMRRYLDLYQHLHQHPELSMQERATAILIEDHLKRIGLATFICGGTGVVGILRNGPGPVVAFRADTDALPMKEQTGLPYASTDTATLPDGSLVPVMHGCGHDSHITCAIAAAEFLAAQQAQWSGTVVFIFQPGEETAAGAAAMVADGLWEKAPLPKVVLAQHLGRFATGTAQTRPGDATSLADSWSVTVLGKGAHGSQPKSAIDPIVIAAYMITRLQSVVSRELAPLESVVVTVGTFHAGLKENVIPSEAVFALNIRTPNDEVRACVLTSVRRIIGAEALASGAPEPIITELYRFPRCHNDPESLQTVAAALSAALGDDNVSVTRPRSMGSEDFGWLGDSIGVPTLLWWYGAYTPEHMAAPDPVAGPHSPFFAPDAEVSLESGIRSALAAILAFVAKDGPTHS